MIERHSRKPESKKITTFNCLTHQCTIFRNLYIKISCEICIYRLYAHTHICTVSIALYRTYFIALVLLSPYLYQYPLPLGNFVNITFLALFLLYLHLLHNTHNKRMCKQEVDAMKEFNR